MAADLTNRIHSSFSTDLATWSGFRDEITGAYINDGGTEDNYVYFTDHVIREFNKKITDLDLPSNLYMEPFDPGFRYKANPVTAVYNSGIAAAFSARTVGLGAGPLLRARRSTDNTEVDVRGDNDGVLSLNSPIIDYRENILPYSEDLSEWSADGITATAIDGANALNDNGFQRVTASAGSKTITETSPTNNPAIAAGDVFTASVYVKNVNVAGGVVKMQLSRHAGGDYEQSEVTLNNTTDEWQRFTVTHTFAQAHTTLRVRLITSSELSSLSADVFGFQLNKGEDAEVYIKTNGITITELDRPQETLGEYIGTGHAYVTNWYDQSATGSDQKNFEQATASYQPLVVESGAIITGGNGKAGVRWDVGKNMYISSQFSGSTLDAFFVADMDVSDATLNKRKYFIILNGAGTGDIPNNNYIIAQSGSTSTSIGALGNANKTLRVNGVDYNPNDPVMTRDDVFELLDHNKLYSTVGGNSNAYTGTHDNILNLGFYTSSATNDYNFEGLMQETILYTGDQLSTRTGIETEMNNHYNMF
jgi:hypothetical protein